MIFQDFTILGGGVHSRRTQNTKQLVPGAVAVCQALLRQMRAGDLAASQPIRDLPPFDVTLGPPAFLHEALGQQVEAAGRFFCCAAPGQPEFQVNYVLPAGPVSESDERAAATLLALSAMGRLPPDFDVEHAVREITEARPVLATALLPVTLDVEMVRVAADFATCFAAALLEEK